MEASQYYDSLIQQGYDPQQAEQYTSQHFPGFTAQPITPVPAVQAAPEQEQSLWAPDQSAAQPVFLVEENKKKIYIAPWIGVGLIIFMMLMPFVQLSFEGQNVGDSMSGFEILGEMVEAAEESDDSGGGDDFDMSEIPEEWVFFGIAILMLMFSPVVYLLIAGVSTALLVFKKHTLVVGIIHLIFFGAFFICSVIGTVDELGVSISAHSNMAGWGFFGAGLAGILLCLKA
jgi:hypothetical protein